jgi:primosomal replication protein N
MNILSQGTTKDSLEEVRRRFAGEWEASIEGIWKNNVDELCGTLGDKPKFSHMSKERMYSTFPLEIQRLSGAVDTVIVTAAQELLSGLAVTDQSHLKVRGELRSFNNKSGKGSKLVLTVFARELSFTQEEEKNSICLTGTLCKPPNLRRTPMGREICDLMLAVNRRYGRSDYLPCIAWGQNAEEAGTWDVGKAVKVNGRIQSRKYIKIEDGEGIEKTAYEVSVISFEDV